MTHSFLNAVGRMNSGSAPLCADCGKIIHDVTEANVAVVGDDNFKMTPAGTYLGAKVTRVGEYAQVFCWACDAKRNNLPWTNTRSSVPRPRRSRAATRSTSRDETQAFARGGSMSIRVIATLPVGYGGEELDLWQLTGLSRGDKPEWFEQLVDREYDGVFNPDWFDHVSRDGEALVVEPVPSARRILPRPLRICQQAFAEGHSLSNFAAFPDANSQHHSHSSGGRMTAAPTYRTSELEIASYLKARGHRLLSANLDGRFVAFEFDSSASADVPTYFGGGEASAQRAFRGPSQPPGPDSASQKTFLSTKRNGEYPL